MARIIFENVDYGYKDTNILNNINLEVANGELFSLVGPSGAGKSTLLNLLAGFLYPKKGRILIDNQNITELPPYKRNVGLVFQSYALFPNMNVFNNVAYGLKIKKVNRSEIKERVIKALSMVNLEQYIKRMPRELSGGQQQRVAIARALVIRPQVLLLDEPLSGLDAKLRQKMRSVIRELQQRVGITTILVTHDQSEALSISDQIAVLGEGKIQQVGTPEAIYNRPVNAYVAEFIGSTNLLNTVSTTNEIKVSLTDINEKTIKFLTRPSKNFKGLKFMIRPENIRLVEHAEPETLQGILTKIEYLGNAEKGWIQLKTDELVFYRSINHDKKRLQTGSVINFSIDPELIVSINQNGSGRF
ncbi:ABC transporter ATP-binding protein [Loigolactobacillus binensis]|uniref:ABC transporter ATP-binding protein n=1 Tax=Loigolactobacillus binensis TaxID=2559922 RepID=A0ABW3EFR4_9LACO|nr:ABC transporter ATP-binding protein [Loigolactobacillus binensis]